jgi:WD40 repeat protein
VEYLDFELEIGGGHGRTYPVAVVASPAGEARGTLHFPFDTLALDNHLLALENALLRSGGGREAYRRTLAPEEQAVQDFGRALFDSLLVADVRSSYEVSRREAQRLSKGLRLKLRITAPELAALPWEFLYDPSRGTYLGLSRSTPLVRYIELPEPVQTLAVTPPLRILGLVASPSDLEPLDVPREKERVEAAIADLSRRRLVELTWLPGQTWRDVQRVMRRGPWHILHFVGHGGFDPRRDEGVVALADEDGRADQLSAGLLGQLLADHFELRLVLLNACEGARGSKQDVFSSTAAALVRRGIPTVLAMQYEISDKAAIEFARSFYEAVADGIPVDEAVAEARNGVNLAIRGTFEWGTPVLYMRSSNGRIFDLAHAATTVESTPRQPLAAPAVPAPPDSQELEPVDLARLDERWTQALGYFYTERWQPAVEILHDIVAERPDYRDAAAKLDKATRQQRLASLYAEGVSSVQANAWAEAIDRLEDVVALDPDYKDAGTLLERARRQKDLGDLYAEADALHQAEAWDAVLKVFERIRAIDRTYPDLAGLLASAGEALAAQERLRITPANAKQVALLRRLDGHDNIVESVTFASDGQTLASGSEDKTVRLWRVADGTLRRTLTGHTDCVNSVAFAPDGQTLASGGNDGTVRLWRVSDGALLRTLTGHDDTVTSVAFAPDGQTLASGSEDKTLRLWRVADGTLRRTLTGHTDCVNSVAFAPDGQTLASAASDETVRLWHVADGTLLRPLKGHTDFGVVAFAPDGQTLASAASDETVRLWHVADGTPVRTLKGHTQVVESVAFAPDGQTLASGSWDSTVRLWRVADGTPLCTLTGHEDTVASVAFAPDGQTLASGSFDNTVWLWKVRARGQ